MEEERPHYDDEIDLVELFQTVWDGKWAIVVAIVVPVLAVFGYQLFQPPPTFVASTEVRPITSIEAERYRASNSVGFFEVSPSQLLNLYIEQLEERSLFEDAILDFGLVEATDYDDEQALNEAVVALASSIEVRPPTNANESERGDGRRFWTVEFEYNDAEKWKSVLSSVDSFANQYVERILQQRFQTSSSIAEQKREFQLEDLATQIENAKRDFDTEMEEFELKQGFRLEDIDTQIENAKRDFDKEIEEFEQTQRFAIEDVETRIENALTDYERTTSDRLAFLYEQTAIARKLGVATNTIEAQMFGAQSGIVANIKTDTPFYLRGYEAIEKEIELIESRDDKRAFTGGLFKLEQKKRELEQDKTIQRAELKKVYLDSLLDLEKKRRKLEQDKTIERAELNQKFSDSLIALQDKKRELRQDRTLQRAETLFASTPIMSNTEFSAVAVTVEATDFEVQSKKMLMLALAILIGGMIGVLYVLISSAVRKGKQRSTVP